MSPHSSLAFSPPSDSGSYGLGFYGGLSSPLVIEARTCASAHSNRSPLLSVPELACLLEEAPSFLRNINWFEDTPDCFTQAVA